MDPFNIFVQSEINKFAQLYVNSPLIDDIINLKLLFDDLFLKKSVSIQNMYKVGNHDKSSYKINSQYFSLRLIFYRSGKSTIIIRHENIYTNKIPRNDFTDSFNLDTGFVYFLKSQYGWKIGKTKNLYNRKKVFEVKLPFDFTFEYYIKTFEKSNLESRLHKYFCDKLINGEWFDLDTNEIQKAVLNMKYKLYFYKE